MVRPAIVFLRGPNVLVGVVILPIGVKDLRPRRYWPLVLRCSLVVLPALLNLFLAIFKLISQLLNIN